MDGLSEDHNEHSRRNGGVIQEVEDGAQGVGMDRGSPDTPVGVVEAGADRVASHFGSLRGGHFPQG